MKGTLKMYTKGNWHLFDDEGRWDGQIYGNGRPICYCMFSFSSNVGGYGKEEREERRANANLISAAPELLVTLKSLLADETTVNCLAATGKLKEVQAVIASADTD